MSERLLLNPEFTSTAVIGASPGRNRRLYRNLGQGKRRERVGKGRTRWTETDEGGVVFGTHDKTPPLERTLGRGAYGNPHSKNIRVRGSTTLW